MGPKPYLPELTCSIKICHLFSQEEEVKVQQEEEEVKEIVAEVASLPPPDPRFGMLRSLGEEQASQLQWTAWVERSRITELSYLPGDARCSGTC